MTTAAWYRDPCRRWSRHSVPALASAASSWPPSPRSTTCHQVNLEHVVAVKEAQMLATFISTKHPGERPSGCFGLFLFSLWNMCFLLGWKWEEGTTWTSGICQQGAFLSDSHLPDSGMVQVADTAWKCWRLTSGEDVAFSPDVTCFFFFYPSLFILENIKSSGKVARLLSVARFSSRFTTC